MDVRALIIVLDVALRLANAGTPNLPDDFTKTTEAVDIAKKPQSPPSSPAPASVVPSIRFLKPAQSSCGVLIETKVMRKDRWLVSEEWCPNCPSAKRGFVSSGGKPDHIITITEAKRRHGRYIGSVPAEYTTDETVVMFQPPEYRSISRMEVVLNGTATPSQSEILKHLRTGGPHAGKHWQKWHLENWPVGKLYALHDDDHSSSVPKFAPVDTEVIEAVVTDAEPSAQAVAAALAMLLVPESQQSQPDTFGSLFDIAVADPGIARKWTADLLSRQSVEFPSAGVSASWGGDRTVSIGKGRVRISPGATVSVRKFGVSVSTTLTGASFADDLSWVTLELQGSPDLTVRFTP